MAPQAKNRNNGFSFKPYKKMIRNWIKSNCKWSKIMSLLMDAKNVPVIACLLVVMELVINFIIIEKVRYTEIDWRAYMQEVEGVLNGTLDYSKLKGDTGPLVYPAGFVYIFSMLYYLTIFGMNIRIAQYFFAIVYAILLILVFRIYAKTLKVPPFILILMCCSSYRIHSIFVLRLFNDPIAMVLFFAAVNAFLDNRWYLGSILYSLAVSVKMNILLFSPALLVAYLMVLGLRDTIIHLSVCATVQIILALPFLITNPIAYIKYAFNFGRVFEFKWTVNWRFLPEAVFLHPYFHISLLILHLLTLAYFASHWITYLKSYAKLKCIEKDVTRQLRKHEAVDMSTVSQLFILPLFTANFIGMVYSRSLHYQFYVWYYHTLPYLTWCTHYSTAIKIILLGIIELCWNVYPSTVFSSAGLHFCHIMILYGLYRYNVTSTKVK
ncbi:lethal(2)neighbour of Tid protein [Orussus abietinus]|uniref:lethal(2)neighbour of Tid protein n=1 Tax=Orussus abietinus TaxID=222816 RepID=UPI000626795C|nr:lethal(2)neighbour of Tid protein [Orussus abietinus]XP_012283510.1 lethal(2)neighbour of Tid protein [Orussus abietinus]XP_012283511.1 lethal(2)neighbour of Tid protein [Orussus abietinus]